MAVAHRLYSCVALATIPLSWQLLAVYPVPRDILKPSLQGGGFQISSHLNSACPVSEVCGVFSMVMYIFLSKETWLVHFTFHLSPIYHLKNVKEDFTNSI